LEKNYGAVFEVSTTIFENGWDFIDFTNGLTEHFRNILSVVVSGKSYFAETAEIFKSKYLDYKNRFSESDLLRLLNYLNKVNQELKYSQNQRLKIEIALSHLIGMEKTSTITEMISNLGNISDTSENVKAINKPSIRNEPAKKFESVSNHPVSLDKDTGANPSSIQQKKMIVEDSPVSSFHHNELDFDDVVKKWEGFIEEINKEKAFILAPIMQKINLLSMKGNHLNVMFDDAQNQKTFEMNEKYIETKSEIYFGKRLKFDLYNGETSGTKNTSDENSQPKKKPSHADAYEQIIINELGGQKLEK
ncbi:MAG TPA: DNA polymerase III subunit gamma/tau, partial [Ignavibacteriaceae bacterium]